MLTIGLEHFSLFVKRTAVVMAHMAPQQGMNWRDHMGAIICLIGYKVVFIYWNHRYMVIFTIHIFERKMLNNNDKHTTHYMSHRFQG